MPRSPFQNLETLPDWAAPTAGLTLLLGLPGAGKSTLLRHLWQIGLGKADARMLAEHFAFPTGWTVEDVLRQARQPHWPDGLPQADLGSAQRADRLSRGQRQLLGLASLGPAPQRPWLIDEPMLGLDSRQGQVVADWLQLQARDRRIIAASHDWTPFLGHEAHAVVLVAGVVRHVGALDGLVEAAEAYLEITPRQGGTRSAAVDVARVLAWVGREVGT